MGSMKIDVVGLLEEYGSHSVRGWISAKFSHCPLVIINEQGRLNLEPEFYEREDLNRSGIAGVGFRASFTLPEGISRYEVAFLLLPDVPVFLKTPEFHATEQLRAAAKGAEQSFASSPSPVGPDRAIEAAAAKAELFFKEFGLLSAEPDFSAALEALNQLQRSAALLPLSLEQTPDATIIIPVHGQLAYTLNCLRSLLQQVSRFTFEIIIADDCSPGLTAKILPELQGVRYFRQPLNGGFIRTCNGAAERARGRTLVFLNNDTAVLENWLDELLGTFEIFPKAGVVGSKLFYPDGLLQEAGGIVWRDGSAWNYGRNDNPNRPWYCYARQCDYVSGASLAVRSDLWRELGGFDLLYQPAYCEDSDLAFRTRAHGFEVWLQPLSKVIHYEGRTSGTDVASGVKSYQVINQAKLFERWQDVLQSHSGNGCEPWVEKDRSFAKRALIIDALTPTPKEDAGSVTAVTTMQLYQDLGYKVVFIPQDNFLYRPGITDDLLRIGVEVIYAPFEHSIENYLEQYGKFFEVIQVFRPGIAARCLDAIKRHAPQAKVVYHNVDLHFLRMEREAELSGDPAAQKAAAAVKALELGVMKRVHSNIVHSPIEAELLAPLAPGAPIVVFPYMTPLEGTDVGYDTRMDLMFLGGYRHPPNVDAAFYLIENIWPALAGKLPQARLLIVGASPPEELRDAATDRIVVTGPVPDLRPWFDRTRVFVAPIRYGAGVKGKVATAMSYGVPVVCSSCAAEGMYLENGRDVLIADSPDAFVESVTRVHADEATWTRYSEQGLAFVEEHNSLSMGRRTLVNVLELAAEKQRKNQHRLPARREARKA